MGYNSEYAQAGVDYKKAEPFRRVMQAVGRRTVHFPNQRDVFVDEEAIGNAATSFSLTFSPITPLILRIHLSIASRDATNSGTRALMSL